VSTIALTGRATEAALDMCTAKGTLRGKLEHVSNFEQFLDRSLAIFHSGAHAAAPRMDVRDRLLLLTFTPMLRGKAA
jgi:hypothetical protein